MLITAALSCLALNIYHEARSEPVRGQYAVALVTINRAGGDADRVCDEVFKHKQFSWTGRVKTREDGWDVPASLYPKLSNKIEEDAWWRAVRITRQVLSGKIQDFTRGSTHYHALSANPGWGLVPALDIGSHRFYLPQKITQS
ncbi:hypothetical protein ATN89_17180 [Comamonas thiooxydans]|uniref:cell wall hydrolase n=1 Tax=Comamonas thiooxydans TaxID=363952 RepID=UPI0007C4B2C1|nr:cell wall hydrolase [Comamonas thiooxydans]OAD82951.1 hypothetical protein ATN89_17180 [Comamonas thiooxydans]